MSTNSSLDYAQSDQIVLTYLKKRGYKNTESSLSKEMDTPLDHFVFDTQLIEGPAPLLSQLPGASEEASSVIENYQKLQRFIEDSLDLYKSELQSVLYPIFVHVYLDLICRGFHTEATRYFDAYKQDFQQQFPSDIQQLSSVTDPLHVQQNPVASLYRQNKYTLLMSSYAFELFLSYLMDSHFMTLLKLVNQYINIKVYSTKPIASMRQDAAVVGITGHTSQQIQSVNQQAVYTAKQPLEPHFQEILEKKLKQINQGDLEDEAWQSMKKSEGEPVPRAEAVPLPPATNQNLVEMIERLNDIRARVKLSSSASLPSAVMYTFHNTNSSLTCCAFSNDYKMIGTGFADSYIKIWSLTGEPLRSLKASTEYTAADFENVEDVKNGCEEEGAMSRRLIGHSGPVYDMAFSQDNKFLISGSEDGTVYRGHNYPIWTVDFGPQSYYFATGSHDRTARVWSCERPNALRIFAGHLSDVECVKFHPNSNYLLTSSSDKTVRMWDIHAGKCVRLFTSSMQSSTGSSYYLPGHPTRTSTILSLACSPDGKIMASGGDDGSVVVWDLASGRVLKRYGCGPKRGRKGTTSKEDQDMLISAVYSLDFSADGEILAAGFADGRLRVYEINKSADTDGVSVDKDDLLGDYMTKRTPVQRVHFTNRNLLLTAGPFIPSASYTAA